MYGLFDCIINKDKSKHTSTLDDHSKKVIIYESELDYLSKCILESPRIETGGNFFGLYTPFDIPIILYAIGPGAKSVHEETHFKQDFDFLDKNADMLVAEHALHHIGSWHSHHSLGLTHPSGGDSTSTIEGMRECGLKTFLLIIGNCREGHSSVRPFRYFANGNHEELTWVILPGMSPIRTAYDSKHSEMIHYPTGKANMQSLHTCSLVDNPKTTAYSPHFGDNYWLSSQENRKELSKIVKYLNSRFEEIRIYQKDESTIEIRVVNGSKAFIVLFNESFPHTAPIFMAKDRLLLRFKSKPVWNMSGKTISEAFIQIIQNLEL